MNDLAVVIPTLNEAEHLPRLIGDLAALGPGVAVVVADGGSRDDTPALAAAAGALVVHGPRGRGRQIRAGLAAVDREWVCVLHADIRLPAEARRDLMEHVARGGTDAAVWRLRIDAPGGLFRVFEWGARLRDRVAGLPYGDQGLLVRRSALDAVGGYPDEPLLEDVTVIRALRRRGAVRRLPSAVSVSARRWEREGGAASWLRNVGVLVAYLLGAPPARLVRFYPPHRA